MGVYFLLQHTQLIADADDFMEKHFERHFLGLERGVGRVQDDLALVPARAELLDHEVRFFKAERVYRGVHGLLDKLSQRDLEAADGGLGFGRFEAAGFRRDGAGAVVKLDVSRGGRDGPGRKVNQGDD